MISLVACSNCTRVAPLHIKQCVHPICAVTSRPTITPDTHLSLFIRSCQLPPGRWLLGSSSCPGAIAACCRYLFHSVIVNGLCFQKQGENLGHLDFYFYFFTFFFLFDRKKYHVSWHESLVGLLSSFLRADAQGYSTPHLPSQRRACARAKIWVLISLLFSQGTSHKPHFLLSWNSR